MPFDGITTDIMARELHSRIAGARIDKVFEPDRQTIVLHIRANARMEKLLISCDPSGARMNLTDFVRDNPKMPPSFCMLLRKYLSGAKIKAVSCPSFERIVEISFSNTDELYDSRSYTLICELMGRHSNIILTNESGKIIDSLFHVDFSVNRCREVMPARIYEYPPAQNKLLPQDCLNICKKNKLPVLENEMSRPLPKALLNSIKGLSPFLALKLTEESGIDDRTPVKDLDDRSSDRLIKVCSSFLTDVFEFNIKPNVCYSPEKTPVDYSPFIFKSDLEAREFPSMSEAVDSFFRLREEGMLLNNKKSRLKSFTDSALSHAVRKLELHKADLEEGSRADYYKKCADLIITYQYRIKPHLDALSAEDCFEDPPSPIVIPLNPALDAVSNSQEYYKRFKKARRKFTLAQEYLKEDEETIAYFRTLKAALDSASCDEDISALEQEIDRLSSPKALPKASDSERSGAGDPNKMVGLSKSGKKASRSMREAARKASLNKRGKTSSSKSSAALSYRKYVTSDGYEILSGRNNIQNDELTFKVASKDDWWFHIKGLPGTHVILRSRKGEQFPSDEAVLQAASTAAYFSKSIMIEEHSAGSSSSGSDIKAEVDYCPVSHVKKIPGARPGMVIYESYYSVLVPAHKPDSNER